MRRSWPFTFNIFMFGGYAFVVPFLVLFYQSAGLTGLQIGLLTGITPLITMVGAPLWTARADATGQHRLIMSLTLLVGALAIFALPYFNSFALILLVAVLFYAFIAPVSPLADSATMFMLADKKEMYGRIRLGGTIGFGLAASLAGVLVHRYGLNMAFWGCAVLLLLALLASQKLVHNPQIAHGSTMPGIRALLTKPRWILFLMVAFAGGLSLAGTNTYLFPFLKELGASESIMGLALTLGTVAEIPVLFFGHHLVKHFKPFKLFMLAMFFTGIRLLAFAVAGSPNLILIVQLFNGLIFPAMWIAGVAYAHENAPAGLSATAQGMFGAMVFGLGSAVGGFAGGPLMENIGGRGTYLVFGGAVLIVVGVVALLQRYLPQEAGSPAADSYRGVTEGES
jgi:MFS transporter, PPP family, 3-phenylpropionic acid transporter